MSVSQTAKRFFTHIQVKRCQPGAILLLAMIFLAVFSALAVAILSQSDGNLQVAADHHQGNLALCAAQSGLECAKYLISTVTLAETGCNVVSDAEADDVWTNLCAHIQGTALDGKSVGSPTPFTDSAGSGDQIRRYLYRKLF